MRTISRKYQLKKYFGLLFLFLSYCDNTTLGHDKVIYEESNLKDFYQIKDSYPHELKLWSRSVAALFSKEMLLKKDSHYFVNTNKIDDEKNFCLPMDDLEKIFSSQQKLSDCTGFLIGPDILATAGHCMETKENCENNFWVFDYKLDYQNQVLSIFPEENVLECDKIVSKEETLLDYAIIKLKRVPLNRTPLKIRTLSDGEISGNPNLVVIGYPLGHPLKFALQSTLRDTSKPDIINFESDTFKGNSGSPLINIQKGWVEGILFSGERDFIYDDHCKRIKYCAKGTCRGEEAVRINKIPEISQWIN